MKWPDGERLLLTIDRVVERPCPTCYVGLGEDVICDICNRTGLYKVRVRGWVRPYVNIVTRWQANLWLMHDGQRIIEVEGVADRFAANPRKWSPVHQAEEPFIKAVIAAHFAGTLPDGVAHITEEAAE